MFTSKKFRGGYSRHAIFNRMEKLMQGDNPKDTPGANAVNPGENENEHNKQAEKYLREGGNIEDYPDPQDQEEADEELDPEK